MRSSRPCPRLPPGREGRTSGRCHSAILRRMTTRDWDARSYDRISNPMASWGVAVLDRLELQGDERVLDAGCGSGRVTEQLLQRLPHGSVVALDGSPQGKCRAGVVQPQSNLRVAQGRIANPSSPLAHCGFVPFSYPGSLDFVVVPRACLSQCGTGIRSHNPTPGFYQGTNVHSINRMFFL